MAKISFTLDTRPKKDGNSAVLMTFIHKRYRKQVKLGIDINPQFWNEDSSEVKNTHPQHRVLNQKLNFFKVVVDGVMVRHIGQEIDAETLFCELESAMFPERAEKKAAEEKQRNTLVSVAKRFTEMKKPSTRLTYERTLKHIEGYVAKGNTENFDEINKAWLTGFDTYLVPSCPSPNARALHMRNLRAILNFAIDEEITTNYPFRRFKIKTVKTAKRNLSVDVLREVLTVDVEDWQVLYRDMFALSFMLMGINFADLLKLTHRNEREGRLEFNRSKTARLYSMKIEPEAAALIEKYAGADHLINIMDTRTDYVQFIRQTNNALRKIGDCERHGLGGKKTITAICPDLSTYWARHSWATIAASLDIPKETIAAALGHGGNSVTDIYIDFDQRKVDEANRKVLDWVLYGKKNGKVVDKGVSTAYTIKPDKKKVSEDPQITVPPKQKKTKKRA